MAQTSWRAVLLTTRVPAVINRRDVRTGAVASMSPSYSEARRSSRFSSSMNESIISSVRFTRSVFHRIVGIETKVVALLIFESIVGSPDVDCLFKNRLVAQGIQILLVAEWAVSSPATGIDVLDFHAGRQRNHRLFFVLERPPCQHRLGDRRGTVHGFP